MAQDFTFEFSEGMEKKEIIEQTIKLLSMMP
jgi:hypothetical protein